MFKGNFTRLLPFWKYYNKNKTYRDFFDQAVKKKLGSISLNIVNKKDYKIVVENFDKDYLQMHINHILLKNTYINFSDRYIIKKKKISLFKIFISELKYFKYFKQFLNKFFYILSVTRNLFIFSIKKKNFFETKKYDILKQFFHGDEYSKLDFCDEMELKKKYKILTIFDTKIKKNFSQHKQLKNFKDDYISIKNFGNFENNKLYKFNSFNDKTKKVILYILKFFFLKPYYTSIILDFLIKVEQYDQIFKNYKIKLFVHGKTIDTNIAAIRQAADLNNILCINYSRSYLPNKFNDVLTQPDELVFAWSKNMINNYDYNINKIKYLIHSYPYFSLLNKSNNYDFKKYKTISLFDGIADEKNSMDPENYLLSINHILDYVISNNETFILVKIKYNRGKEIFLKRFGDKVKKLKKINRILILSQSYYNNHDIYKNSFLNIGMTTLSTTLEALYNYSDGISLVQNSYDKIFLEKINKIYPFAYKDSKEFIENFEKKIKNKKKNVDEVNKLREFFFEQKNQKNSKKFLDIYLSSYEKDLKKSELINRILNVY